MNAINMQVIESIAEHQWEVIYSGNNNSSSFLPIRDIIFRAIKQMNDNLESYIEITSLKLYTNLFFEGHTLEEYNFKSFSFYLQKEKDIIKIISRHNQRIKLKINFAFSTKLSSTEKLYEILNILEQQYNIEIRNPST